MSEIMCYKCKNGKLPGEQEECQYCHDGIWRGYWMAEERSECEGCIYCNQERYYPPCNKCSDKSEFEECESDEEPIILLRD